MRNSGRQSLHGLLVIDKPVDMTSHDVVARLRQCLPRRTKVGHAGTLDPLASGVLVVCVGAATRLCEYVQRMEKEYDAVVRLGATSTTDDAEGEITPTAGTEPPTHDAVAAALETFVGEIDQVPPVYSAAKVAGKRAHRLARAGAAVELAPRRVVIHEIELLAYDYPRLAIRVRCGKGTYIRSLARDLGRRLHVGGYLEDLRRTRIGPFTVEDAATLEACCSDIERHMKPVDAAVAALARVDVDASAADSLKNGRPVPCPKCGARGEAAVYYGGQLIAIGRCDPRGQLRPVKVLSV